ncbi:hypothetical protein GGS26DRAFT_593915 [Hypomontagnella submonticulosa]|nr:hypothetical protein GGS26DRAFT_593915 [Hypomontagnella submonticulosa]
MSDESYFELNRNEVGASLYSGDRLELIGLFDDTVLVRPLGDLGDDGPQDDHSEDISSTRSLVATFLRNWRKDFNDGTRIEIKEDETFFPTPLASFLIDQPEKLVCQICYSTELRMAPTSANSRKTAPAILPCGHIACATCLEASLSHRGECPFCREDVVHRRCGHSVKPILISYETITTVPRTFPEGGKMDGLCKACRDQERLAAAIRKWKSRAGDIKYARQLEANGHMDPRQAAEIMRAKTEHFAGYPHSYAHIMRQDNEFW